MKHKKKKLLFIIGLIIIILIAVLCLFLIKDAKKYEKYNQYNNDNKTTAKVMHYNDENDNFYISIFYPKTENKNLNKLVNNHYQDYIKQQKVNKNKKDILYMDYSISEQFNQFINLSLYTSRYDENNKQINNSQKMIAYDLKNNRILKVEDCLRRGYQHSLKNISGIENINADNTNIQVKKDSFVIYTDNTLKEKVTINYEENKATIRLSNKNIPSFAPANVKIPAPQPKVDSNKKLIAFTLDDGPHKTNTLKTVELFEKYNGRATFLMLGKNVKQYPDIVKDVYEHGFEIGSHSYDHPDLRKLSSQEIENQIKNTQEEIFKITGYEPEIIRPPYGATNDLAKQIIKDNGMKIALWNIDTLDWKLKDANKIRDVIVDKASDGAVVLIHDIHSFTIKGLEMALDELSKDGYQFVSLDTLSQHRQLKNIIR